jgi:multidrug resistance efflux pump
MRAEKSTRCLSRRQLTGCLLSSLALIPLSNSVSLSARSAEFDRIYSPRDEFVEKLLVGESQIVIAGQPVLKMGSLEVERQLMRYSMQLKILDLTDERLTSEYLDKYVFGPMEALKSFRQSTVGTASASLDWLQGQQRFSGAVSQQDIQKAEAGEKEQDAELLNSDDSLAKKKLDIEKQKAAAQIERAQLTKTVALMRNLIEISTIVSPSSGRVQFHTVAGVFVEKGDLLFEVV